MIGGIIKKRILQVGDVCQMIKKILPLITFVGVMIIIYLLDSKFFDTKFSLIRSIIMGLVAYGIYIKQPMK